MPLEAATWLTDLDPTNPPSSDQKKQGDDHIRMLKDVLKRTLPTASKAFYFPNSPTTKTGNFSVLAADMNKTFTIDTTTLAITVTLPTLALTDAGWECSFVKINPTGTNPYYVTPASGTVRSGDQTVNYARRSVPGRRIRALWTGSIWIIERAVDVPIGTVLDCPRSGLPAGYVYASAQTLGGAEYPEYVAAMGSGFVPDRRGVTAFGKDDFGLGAAGRLGGAFGESNVSVLHQVIGAETFTLTQAKLPNYALTVNLTDPGHFHGVTDIGHAHSYQPANPVNMATPIYDAPVLGSFTVGGAYPGAGNTGPKSQVGVSVNTQGTGISVAVALNGTGQAQSKVPPGVISNFIVVVE